MSKLAAFKEKAALVRTQLSEKTEQIPIVKKWKAAREEKAKQGPDPLSLGEIYRKGNVGTRLQVILMFAFAMGSVAFTARAGRKILGNLSHSSAANVQLQHDVAHGLEHVKEHATEEAKVVALGQFTAAAFGGPSGEAKVNVDLWLRVSDPEAAAFVEQNSAKLSDAAAEALDRLYRRKVDFLTDEGKDELRHEVLAALNEEMTKGKVDEVLFQNLVVQ